MAGSCSCMVRSSCWVLTSEMIRGQVFASDRPFNLGEIQTIQDAQVPTGRNGCELGTEFRKHSSACHLRNLFRLMQRQGPCPLRLIGCFRSHLHPGKIPPLNLETAAPRVILNHEFDSLIRCKFEFDSNTTDVSDQQLEKQYLHTTSTDAGTYTFFNSVQFRLRFQSYRRPNAQPEKDDLYTTSIDVGT
jgi:hypothetical protein